MKNVYLVFGLILSYITIASFIQEDEHEQAASTCDVVAIRAKSKEALKPDYQYDASKTTHVMFLTKKQFKELEIPLYIGEKYRFVFNTQSLPQNVDIEIYDKKYEAKDRHLLFSSKEATAVDKQFVFEPQKAMRKVYLDYHIQATETTEQKGCIVLTIGYKIKK